MGVDLANRGLAPMTAAAEAWREADLEQFDATSRRCAHGSDDVGAVMARRRAEGRRA